MFDKTEKLTILEQSVRTLMNMVPHNMDVFRRVLNNTDHIKFDFFQPLENLRGQSMANFCIRHPDVITREIEALEDDGDKMAKSLIEEVCEGDIAYEILMQNDWIRQRGEPCYDLHFNTILNHGFNDESIVTSLKIIIEHILSLNTSKSIQRMVSSIVPILLEYENDDFECFRDYFIAIDPEAADSKEDSKKTSFMLHLKDPLLPGFADEEIHVDQYSSSMNMQTDLRTPTTKRIMDRFEQQKIDDPEAMLDIKVDHFSLTF